MTSPHETGSGREYACRIRPLYTSDSYRYTVIFARYREQWLFCRHRSRDTWETAGGHIEPGETPLEGAKRELWEETGAARFTIAPVFDYRAGGSCGVVFCANVEELGRLPAEFEMERLGLFDGLPGKLTYPHISPVLYRELMEQFCVGFERKV